MTTVKNEFWHKIDEKNESKKKIKYSKKIYEAIKNENQQYNEKHNGLRMPELSIISRPPYQAISKNLN